MPYVDFLFSILLHMVIIHICKLPQIYNGGGRS